MKALTVSQPFASLIASGAKWVENRTWWHMHRGRIAIHAGTGVQYLDLHSMRCRGLPYGCVIATAQLVAMPELLSSSALEVAPSDRERLRAAGISEASILTHEHTEGPALWVLADIRPLPAPIPQVGAVGLWDWDEASRPPKNFFLGGPGDLLTACEGAR